MRVILAVALGLMLTACSIDPCSIDSTSPSCAANRAVAQQTISVADATREAIAAQAAMKATQNAVAMKAQATQGAINSRATALYNIWIALGEWSNPTSDVNALIKIVVGGVV